MGAAKILLTAEEFDNYPFQEDKRYELDEGELIEMTKPAYPHNRVMKNLIKAMLPLEAAGIGELMVSENLYAISPKTRLSPDLAFILGDRASELKNATVIPVIPEIAVEILSPSERPGRIQRKLRQYFEAGVKEIWMIDPPSRTLEIWRATGGPERELSSGEVLTSPLLPGFSLPLAELFS